MKWAKDLNGRSVELVRRLPIGSTVTAGQVVVRAGINGPGVIEDPGSVNAFTKAAGVTLEAGTYAVASPHVGVLVSCSPSAVFRTVASGGTAADTAHTTACILTQAGVANMTTVVADANVATLDYSTGYLLGLTGANAGHWRVLTGQADNTSCTVTIPFAAASVIGDTFFRTYAPFVRGVELTTNFEEVNNLIAAGEALDTSSIGDFVVYDVLVDGMSLDFPHGEEASAGRDPWIPILNPTNPALEFEVVFNDHAFNRID